MSLPLSIVIPSYNRPDLLARCLASVTQHAPVETEVIVVDDGSAHERIRQTAEAFAQVRTIRLPRRRGFCVAANRGIQAARYPVVELLNDDTEVTTGWAQAALAWFREPAVASVAPLVLRAQGAGQGGPACIDSAGDRYYVGGVARKHDHARRLGSVPLRARRVFGASASSAFYRREALLQVGGFPEEFGSYFEDVDLAFRLNRAGYRSVFEPASRIHHHIGASHHVHRRLLEQQSRNEEMVFWRNLPGRALLRALPAHVAVLAGKALLRWWDGGLLPFLSGRLRALGEWPRLLHHRQRLRQLGPDADIRAWGVETAWFASLDRELSSC